MAKLSHSLEWHWKRVDECAKRAEAMQFTPWKKDARWDQLVKHYAEVKKNGK